MLLEHFTAFEKDKKNGRKKKKKNSIHKKIQNLEVGEEDCLLLDCPKQSVLNRAT
jgi:hypothetical protein